MTPLLKLFFVLSYVVLAAFVGAFADSRPKGHVMFVTNSIKVVGCLTECRCGIPARLRHVGFGAAAYSPPNTASLRSCCRPTGWRGKWLD